LIRKLLALCALAGGASVGASAPDTATLTQYEALPAHKAVAAASADIAGMVGGHPSEAAAAVAAFQNCESRRALEGAPGTCEVVRVDGTAVESGAEIKARVPAGRHPLFLWRYEGTGTVYLAGSMHVMKPSLHPLPAQIEAAFRAADRIAVEVNTAAIAPQRMQALMQSVAMLPPDQTLASVLPDATETAVERYLAQQGIPLTAVARLKPALLATQLAVSKLTALGYFPQFGLDQYFISRAGSRRILELETVEEQLTLLTSPSLALQAEMVALTLEQMPDVDELVADLVVAWLSGDDVALRALFDEQSPQTEAYLEFNRQLLDERNVGMANKIEGYLGEPGTVLVLVGAAHLAGPSSVIDVLRARGLQGRRIHSDESI